MLAGRYETLKAIASGGMATVHLGRAVGVGGFERLVAIKVMHPHIAAESEFVDMFLDEARLAARIRHPNVVATLDVQADDGLFLVMEYVDGPSLRALRTAWRQALPAAIAMRIVSDALTGLHAAHELIGEDGMPVQLVHRDVSPANILIGADGVVRITDFGVARAETRLSSTRGGQLKGKIPYMPPEQLMGETVDRRCDIYAAGVVMWEELTGKRLFRAESEGALLQKILAGPTHTPREVNGNIPAALDAVCMRALARNPTDRYPTAADFADALEDAAAAVGLELASTRALARFVENAGHEKLDARRVGELKRAPPSARDVVAPRVSLASESGSFSSAAHLITPPSFGGPAPSAHSGVTTTEATVSTRIDAPPKSSHRGIVIGGALLALGLAGGFMLARGGATSDTVAAPAAAPSPEADEPPVAAPEQDASDASDAPPPASAEAAASASAQVPPTSAPIAPTPPRPAATVSKPSPKANPKPLPKPKKPKPKSKTYDPDRL